ncbi:EthD family reductase [Rhodococcus wratislaviensis]|nr:EthD family reductase [Rhodococcus sp. 3A]MBC2898185.1 EthD family reductase [Rhodococcus sp. 4CII]
MYQLTATYNHPQDPDAFLGHYRSTHVPIAREFPKAAIRQSRGEGGND